MTRDQAKQLAEELARECWESGLHYPPSFWNDRVTCEARIGAAILLGIERATATDYSKPHVLEYELGDHPGFCNCGKLDSDPIHQLHGEHRIADLLRRSGVPDAEQLIRWMESQLAERECQHPSDSVTADILEGDGRGAQVRWCRLCGAVARDYVPALGEVHRGEWRRPGQ